VLRERANAVSDDANATDSSAKRAVNSASLQGMPQNRAGLTHRTTVSVPKSKRRPGLSATAAPSRRLEQRRAVSDLTSVATDDVAAGGDRGPYGPYAELSFENAHGELIAIVLPRTMAPECSSR